MKTLKFVTELIPLILSGEKTSTWRLFDDKDLQVGDELSFIDRITREEFAKARIVSIHEKTLGQMSEADFDAGHERFESPEKMLEVYQSAPYYGDTVTMDTPVKILQFKLMKNVASKVCDHTSVGMLVWKDGGLLLIERKKPPFGFSPPAGHVDEDVFFEDAARRELEEEVGLRAKEMTLLVEGRKENLCRRDGGSWHYWKIYSVETDGEIRRSLDKTKQARYFGAEELSELATKTDRYIAGEIKQEAWEESPGLEPVWYEWLKKLRIL